MLVAQSIDTSVKDPAEDQSDYVKLVRLRTICMLPHTSSLTEWNQNMRLRHVARLWQVSFAKCAARTQHADHCKLESAVMHMHLSNKCWLLLQNVSELLAALACYLHASCITKLSGLCQN